MVATAAAAQNGPDPLDPAHMEDEAPAQAEAPATDVAPPAVTPPATPTPDAAAEAFTDTQIESFVTAAMAINDLDPEGNLAPAEKREQAEAILASEGLDYATYAAIGQAAQSDPAVAQRVRDAMPQPQSDG